MKWRSLLPILANLLCLLGLLGVAAWTMLDTGRQQARLERLHAELESTLMLGQASGGYATQLAQVLLLGREQHADLRAARLDMERAFVRLSQAARNQAVAAIGPTDTQDALKDVENARRMLELYHAIDLAASRAIVLDRDLRQDEARQIYDREVDFRLSREFAALLVDAQAGVQARLQQASDETLASRQQLVTAWIAAAIVALAVFLISALVLLRRAPPAGTALTEALEAQAEALRDSNRRLRETDAKRAQFLADVSHELRTPLTILRGEADVALLPKANTGEQRRSLERIQEQAADMGQLLDDLIAFARSDGEQQPLQLTPMMLDDLLAAATQEAETLAEPREVTLDLRLPEKPVWVSADMRRLKQALLIGLDNAINHSPPGSAVDITLVVTSAAAEVSIMDRGPGISAHDQPHVFDRFYRGSDGAGGSFGLGIGLAIARGIVDQHHGTIALTNRTEGGAILTITLPLPSGPIA